jgi:hypothetical protein
MSRVHPARGRLSRAMSLPPKTLRQSGKRSLVAGILCGALHSPLCHARKREMTRSPLGLPVRNGGPSPPSPWVVMASLTVLVIDGIGDRRGVVRYARTLTLHRLYAMFRAGIVTRGRGFFEVVAADFRQPAIQKCSHRSTNVQRKAPPKYSGTEGQVRTAGYPKCNISPKSRTSYGPRAQLCLLVSRERG